MSAKWRRNKRDAKRFNIFRVFRKPHAKNDSKRLQVKNRGVGRQIRPHKYNARKFSVEKELKAPEPLIDVLEENDEIIVVAEFAGFGKENLRIHLKEQRLTLSADTSERKFRKSLNLPKRVIPNTLCTAHKNGVLEIRLKKVAEEKTLDKVAD